jgi:hypothetical protein
MLTSGLPIFLCFFPHRIPFFVKNWDRDHLPAADQLIAMLVQRRLVLLAGEAPWAERVTSAALAAWPRGRARLLRADLRDPPVKAGDGGPFGPFGLVFVGFLWGMEDDTIVIKVQFFGVRWLIGLVLNLAGERMTWGVGPFGMP